MALKPCTECGIEISRRAKKCPHCGIPKPFMPKSQRAVNDVANGLMAFGCLLIIVVPLVIILIGVVAGLF